MTDARTFSERYIQPDGKLRPIPDSEARANVLAYADQTNRHNVELRESLERFTEMARHRGEKLVATFARALKAESRVAELEARVRELEQFEKLAEEWQQHQASTESEARALREQLAKCASPERSRYLEQRYDEMGLELQVAKNGNRALREKIERAIAILSSKHHPAGGAIGCEACNALEVLRG